MRKQSVILITVILFLFIVSGAFVYVYFYIEKPGQEEIKEKAYVNIFAYDENNRRIVTGYKIFVGGEEIKNGTTSYMGGIKEKVPKNRTIKVYNYNMEDQNYYLNAYEFRSNDTTENYRADLFVKSPGELKISRIKKLRDNGEKAFLEIQGKKDINFLSFCIDRTSNILYTDIISENFTKIENPARFEFYDKCYTYKKDIFKKGDESRIEIKYLLYSQLKDEDSIDFVFFDGNLINNEIIYNENIGMEDIEYELKNK
ncbi:MAG: hypothetical protein ACOCV1_04415 [Bacillota bacterium]